MKRIRNFSIIAHVDHGKSTLSDRLIQVCGGFTKSKIMRPQILDSMDLERERGITIKAQCVTLNYKALDGLTYQLNFIDTPGHVDFFYEVSRSLAASEGVLLLVDAGQGVEAQTLANCYAAIEMNLKIVLVLSKIDLPTADPNRVLLEIESILGIDTTNTVHCSAKTGFGIFNVLEKLVHDIPSPSGNPNAPLQALIIDSWFDNYLGVISLVCIKNGTLRTGNKIRIMSTQQSYCVEQLGIFTPKRVEKDILGCGEIGWLVCNIKDIHGARVGDTLTLANKSEVSPIPGFKKIKPQVYAGLFPLVQNDYDSFRVALEKLSLNDSSLFYEPESSTMLGLGFRCGFLGLLHMEIVQERLEREYNLNLITTAPTVVYEVIMNDNNTVYIDTPSKMPSNSCINEVREPIAECHLLLPRNYLGNILKLCQEKRGTKQDMLYYNDQVALTYDIPMCELVANFFDRMKSISNGYASINYEFKCFKKSNIVRIDIVINGDTIDALATISHKDSAPHQGRKIVDMLRQLIPRQQFNVSIQAVVNNRVIARATTKQFRKDVLSKCHGRDITRKQKLLHKQKTGKKRMKKIGRIELPKEAFLAVLHAGAFNKQV